MPDQSNAVAVVEQPKAIEPFRQALDREADRIAELLPETMDARRFASVSLIALSKNPDLLKCDRGSFLIAVLEAAEVGLEPTGAVGGAHLVGFGGKIQLIYDYRGVQHLIREGGGGEVKTVLVYEGDYFKVYEGTEKARIRHTPKFLTKDPAKIEYVYAVPLDHPEKFEVMTKSEIDAIRARSKAKNSGPWVTDYGAMARKTVLKRIAAWLPLKPSTRAALERDTLREIGGFEQETEEVAPRAASLKERIKRNRRQAEVAEDAVTAENGPGADEKGDPGTSAPEKSADQQTAENEPVDAETREVCGAESDPALGSVEVCVLAFDHLTADGALQRHQSGAGTIWPAEKPK